MAVAQGAEHTCDPDRRLDFELFQLREEISGLDAQIEGYLSSTRGRFEQWYAEHERQSPPADDPDDEQADEPGA